ncbi:hypothetical protein B0H63DRAFT_519421 [Podospora didyma]|uniref:F-box domain-containing protein n=1 Tax=Podospora didyma TaxID=330526 RepID=A0AAE0U442_9PEZI|nr:hypothetical protein B0H63DRAFT_519421 [Podospora didyma]
MFEFLMVPVPLRRQVVLAFHPQSINNSQSVCPDSVLCHHYPYGHYSYNVDQKGLSIQTPKSRNRDDRYSKVETEDEADSDDEIIRAEMEYRQLPLNLRDAGMNPLSSGPRAQREPQPINRLPDELMLRILGYLGDGELSSKLCLRRVSRRFRRVLDDPKMWKDPMRYLAWAESGHRIISVSSMPTAFRKT